MLLEEAQNLVFMKTLEMEMAGYTRVTGMLIYFSMRECIQLVQRRLKVKVMQFARATYRRNSLMVLRAAFMKGFGKKMPPS